jgi:hypothetical protein
MNYLRKLLVVSPIEINIKDFKERRIKKLKEKELLCDEYEIYFEKSVWFLLYGRVIFIYI